MQPICDIWRYDPPMNEKQGNQLEFREWLGDQMDRLGRLDQTEFANLVGVSQSSISDWLRGEGFPRRTSREKLAKATGRPIEEINRVIAYSQRRAGDVSIRTPPGVEVGTRVNIVVEPTLEPVEVAYVPILGTAAAGDLRAYWGPGDLYPIVKSDLRGISRARLLVVSGHCMEPVINHGDLVVVDVDADPQLGNVVVVRVGDDVTLKEFWADDGDEVILRPRNSAYDVIRVKKEDQGAALVGVVRRRYPASIPI